MEALEDLAADHRVFSEMLSALERELADPAPTPARVERLLKALLEGLEEHEAAEALLLAAPAEAHPRQAAQRRERDDLAELKDVLRFMLESGADLNTLRRLDARLRGHLRLAEETLWPTLRLCPPRLSAREAAELDGHLRRLEGLRDQAAPRGLIR